MGIDYSIIIPHRNIPELLVRCLDSIPVREDVQVIVIDDNSNPESVEKLKAIELRYSNVLFKYTKEGKGAGYARNFGLDLAEGKWLVFADADDFFYYSLSQAMNEYVDCDSDIVFFKGNTLDNETFLTVKNEPRTSYYNQLIDEYSNRQEDSENALRYSHPVPWCKFFRRSFICSNGIKFEETPINNDVRFAYLTGYHAKRIQVANLAIYASIDRRNNLTSVQFKYDNMLTYVSVWGRFLQFSMTRSIPENVVNNVKEDLRSILVEAYLEDKQQFAGFAERILSLGVEDGIVADSISEAELILKKRKRIENTPAIVLRLKKLLRKGYHFVLSLSKHQ